METWNVGDFDSCCQLNVRDFTKNQESVGENLIREKWPKTLLLAAWSKPDYLLVFKIVSTSQSLCILFWFQIMHCCIPTPTSTTDNNTSTSMV